MLFWCLSLSWKASRFYTLLQIVSQAVIPLLVIGASFVGKYLLNLLAGSWKQDDTHATLVSLSIALLLIALLRLAIERTTQYAQSMHSEMIQKNVAIMMMDKSLQAGLEFFDNPKNYDKQLSAFRDSFAIPQLFWNALITLSAFISFIVASIVLARENWIYLSILLPATIPAAVISAYYTKSLYILSLEQLNNERQLSYFQSLAIDRRYAQDLRLYNAAEGLKQKYKNLWLMNFDQRKGVIKRKTIQTSIVSILPEIVMVGIGFDVAKHILASSATIGDYALITGLVTQVWVAVTQLTSSIIQVQDNKLRIDNMRSFEAITNRVLDHGKRNLKKVESISFENVSFCYPETKSLVLEEVSFKVKLGEKIAIVGVNGSGKTTLIKLLLRMYEPGVGVIKVNDIDIKEYSLESLRSNFSVFFQDMANFSFSFRDNFLITDESHPGSERSINQLLEQVDLIETVSRTGTGLDTCLTKYFSEKGVELSGGQHQKLALARTLFRRNTAVVLDEPSSNLDPKAEHDIFSVLEEYTKNKVTIFTSHRLSNVYLADKIVVLERGHVIEEGTQAHLLQNKSRFAELFQYQKEKFEVPQKTSHENRPN